MLNLVDDQRTDESIVKMAIGAANEMLGGIEDSGRVSMYEGTRWECEAFLDSYFSIQRNVVLGARSAASEDEAEGYDRVLETLDRRAYRVTVRPLGMVTGDEVRPENEHRVMRLQTALGMYDAIARSVREEREDASEESENVPNEPHDVL